MIVMNIYEDILAAKCMVCVRTKIIEKLKMVTWTHTQIRASEVNTEFGGFSDSLSASSPDSNQ